MNTEAQQQALAAAEAALQNENVQRYLGMIRQAEGTAQHGDPYRVAGGGAAVLPDLTNYRRVPWKFKTTKGEQQTSTAAGAYQFIEGTWGDAAQALGLKDFSPRSQDLAAAWLLQRSGSIGDVASGNFAAAVAKDNQTWASLPGSPYDQKTRSPEYVSKALGGVELDLPNNSVQIAPGVIATGDTDKEIANLGKIRDAQVPVDMKMRMADTQRMISELDPQMRDGAPLFGDDLPSMFDADLRRIIEMA